MKYEELTHKIIGCAMKVHSTLGNGFQELKALIRLEDVHLAQAMNYCQAYNLPIGLLINFGSKSLEFKRVYNVNHPDNKTNLKQNVASNKINKFNEVNKLKSR